MSQRFKEQIFVFPIGELSNENIAKDPSLMQVEPCLNAKCYFGKNMKELSVYPVDSTVYKGFIKSNLSFYAFVQKTSDSHRQFFKSKGSSKKTTDPLLKEINELIAEIKVVEEFEV